MATRPIKGVFSPSSADIDYKLYLDERGQWYLCCDALGIQDKNLDTIIKSIAETRAKDLMLNAYRTITVTTIED